MGLLRAMECSPNSKHGPKFHSHVWGQLEPSALRALDGCAAVCSRVRSPEVGNSPRKEVIKHGTVWHIAAQGFAWLGRSTAAKLMLPKHTRDEDTRAMILQGDPRRAFATARLKPSEWAWSQRSLARGEELAKAGNAYGAWELGKLIQ
jgi:hypothetical protein